jgi:YHS domain-containing protein
MAMDPVCMMDVHGGKEAPASVYKGKTYYFCAIGCKKALDSDPEASLATDPPLWREIGAPAGKAVRLPLESGLDGLVAVCRVTGW